MNANIKIALTAALWLPAFVLGIFAGIFCYGFKAGFEVYDAVDSWFRESEAIDNETNMRQKGTQ